MAPAVLQLDSPIGAIAIAFTDRGVAGVDLAGRRRSPLPVEDAPPTAAAREVADAIGALLGATGDDARRAADAILRAAPLDDAHLPDFDRRVHALARAIPPGRTRTYGELAVALDQPGAAQAVGRALGRNPFPIVVPCHRIVAADGGLGGFSAPGGPAAKRRLLALEGAWQYDQAPLFA